jgi:sterol desaturase/sphingolipid hydroxylase (fatty acid hydroxylase superfamily)
MSLPPQALWVLPVFALLIALEVLWYRRANRRYPWVESLSSLGVWVGRVLIGLVGAGLIALIYDALWRATPLRIPMDNVWSWALLFLGVEFFYYWFHRCSHEIRWLWATHAVHHSAEQIHLVAAYRLGWTATISGSWLFYLPLVAMGFHPAAVILMIGIDLAYQFWLHTEAIGRLPRWFEYVFNTPSHHRVHHAVNPEYLDTNYGGVIILFDRWFGTFAAERDAEPCKYGLVDPIKSRNPFVIAFREWVRLGRDLWTARGWRARVGYALGRPGWKPDGGGHTTAEIRRAAGLRA